MKTITLPGLNSTQVSSILEVIGFKKETLIQGLWLLAVTVVTGVFNYLANIAVGRMLIPSEYSEYASLLSMSLILGSVTAVLQTVITSQVSNMQATSSISSVGSLIKRVLRTSLLWSGLIWLVLILFSGIISRSLKLNTVFTVIIMGSSLVPLTGLSILQGGMRGLERYFAFGVTMIGSAFLRLILGVALIFIGWRIFGATASIPLSTLIVFVLSILWAAKIFNRSDGQKFPNLTGMFNYTIFTAVGLFAFTNLFSMDVIVVKGLFPAQEAGYYSAVATLGKIVLYLPSAAATLVLSKIAILDSTKQSTIQVLWKSLLVVGSLCAFTTVVFYLAPSFIVGFFFGSNYLEHYNLLGPYGLAMLFYSMTNIWLVYFLALREKIYSYALFAITVAQAIVLSTMASGLSQIIYFMIFFGILANLAGFLLLRRKDESLLSDA